jgi:hypothetical protein
MPGVALLYQLLAPHDRPVYIELTAAAKPHIARALPGLSGRHVCRSSVRHGRTEGGLPVPGGFGRSGPLTEAAH